jgi:hypothetical protein
VLPPGSSPKCEYDDRPTLGDSAKATRERSRAARILFAGGTSLTAGDGMSRLKAQEPAQLVETIVLAVAAVGNPDRNK